MISLRLSPVTVLKSEPFFKYHQVQVCSSRAIMNQTAITSSSIAMTALQFHKKITNALIYCNQFLGCICNITAQSKLPPYALMEPSVTNPPIWCHLGRPTYSDKSFIQSASYPNYFIEILVKLNNSLHHQACHKLRAIFV